MHRLQPVARIRQRARHDHAHGVIEIGALHLVEDGNGTNIRGRRRLAGLRYLQGQTKGESGQFSAENHIAHRGLNNHPERRSGAAVFPFVFSWTYRACRAARFAAEPLSERPESRCPERASRRALSRAENHRVHDPPGHEGEQPGNDQRAGKDRDHRRCCVGATWCRRACNTPSTSMTGAKIDSRWIGLQGPEQPDLVDPERADRDHGHQTPPRSSPASGAAACPSARRAARRRARRPPSRQRREAGSPERRPAAARATSDALLAMAKTVDAANAPM